MMKVTLEHGGRNIHAEGKTIEEALRSLESRHLFKVKSVLSISNGNGIISKVLLPAVVNRMFHPSTNIKELAIARISAMFDFSKFN